MGTFYYWSPGNVLLDSVGAISVSIGKGLKNTDEKKLDRKHKVFTFVGKPLCLTENSNYQYYVFQKYINIVENGVNSFNDKFITDFHKTTIMFDFEIFANGFLALFVSWSMNSQ